VADCLLRNYIEVPIGEIVITLIVLYPFLRKTKSSYAEINAYGVIGLTLLIAWVLVSGLVNGLEVGEITRNIIKNTFLFLPVLLFPAFEKKGVVINILLGFIIAFGLHYIFLICSDLVTMGSISVLLKDRQPTPLLLIIAVICLRDFLTPLTRIFLSILAVVLFGIALCVGARASILSLIFAGFFWVFGYMFRRNFLAVPVLLILCLSAHTILAFSTTSVLDIVYKYDLITESNKERAFLLDYSKKLIEENPWTGVGRSNFVTLFYSTGFSAMPEEGVQRVEGPHNSFMDALIFYGIPGAVCFAFMLYILTVDAMRKTPLSPSMFAFCIGLLIRCGMFLEFTGIYRYEVLLMWAIVYGATPKHAVAGGRRLHSQMQRPQQPGVVEASL
jgi:O-antigen ligase